MKNECEKRLFIGIPTGREIQPILFDIQTTMAHNPGQIRWVPHDNIHITLSFLGNVSIDKIPKLTKALEDVLNLTHFKAFIEKTGVFPSSRFPQILWLGMGKGRQKMITLHAQIEKTIALFKQIRKKENFIPHVTIGRATRSYRKINVLPFLEYVYSPRELDINLVVLYESQLLQEGIEYKVLTEFLLN